MPPVATIERLEAVIIVDPQLASQPCKFPPEDAGGNEAELRMNEADTAPPSLRLPSLKPRLTSPDERD
jgi:hypothetical protein